MKNFLDWMTHTKLGWLLISFLWTAVFMIINDNIESDWAFFVAIPAIIYMVGLILVGIVFAFIINPIRDYKANKKTKIQ